MPVYQLSKFTLQSNFLLPELILCDRYNADLKVVLCRPSLPKKSFSWTHHWYADDESIIQSFTKLPDHYLIRITDLADILIFVERGEIRCIPRSYGRKDTIRHVLLDQALPFLLHAQGELVLHAGAIQRKGRAIAFLGDAGAGKSTLVASLVASGQQLVTDDCLLVECQNSGVVCYPYYPDLRLWPDSLSRFAPVLSTTRKVSHYSTKQRVLPQTGEPAVCGCMPIPLDTFFILDRERDRHTNGIAIELLPQREAFMALTRYAFRLDVTDLDRIKRDMDEVARLVEKTRTFSLSFPRQWDRLPDVHEAIISAI